MILIEERRQTKAAGEKPMAGHVRAELSTTNQEWQAPPPSPTVRGLLDSTLPSPPPAPPTAERGMFTEHQRGTRLWDPSCLVAQSCPTLWNPMGRSPPGSSVHGISQTRILECVAISSFRGSSRLRDRTCISCDSCTAGGFFSC